MNSLLTDYLILTLATVGVVFMLISALGILRLPDVFTRMHAAGKAATLGVSCLLLAAGIFFGDGSQFWRMVALIALFFVTAPIATTTMARAAYRTGKVEEFRLSVDEMAETEREA
ncbi:MAG: monovalent cation/H(+) antiporter subunit G [Chloroflexi bacterium]|nr:monovalent cation/H(+) antiporter subunit G [Chloroflexota bacterium]